ncbi:MAG: hypothetical protein L6Q54_11700 [Leptospiraceae bacterium]|nr:hypothetical protein [Leptospiraceae bacterium]
MPFINVEVNTYGQGIFGTRAINQYKTVTIFISPVGGDIEIGNINLSTQAGSLITSLALGVPGTIVKKIKFDLDVRGCGAFEFQLVDIPKFPIPVNTKISFALNGEQIYSGYVWKIPVDGTEKKDTFIYSGFGFNNKMKDRTIELTSSGSITSITNPVGTTYRYNYSGIIPGIGAGQIVFNKDCSNSANDGKFVITGIGSGYYEVTNIFGAVQAGASGSFRVLPPEWSASMLVSNVFKQIASTYGLGLGVSYNALNIVDTLGYVTYGSIDFSGMTLEKAFDLLRKFIPNHYLGIDGTGTYFIKEKPSDIEDNLFVGYGANDLSIDTNFDSIKNIITVTRAKSKSEGGNGWIVSAIGEPASDAETSIAKYGRREEKIQIPAFFDDSAGQAVADNALALKKDPRIYATIKKIPMTKIYPMSDYGLVTKPDEYRFILDECDVLTGWTNGANIIQALDSNILMSGSNSLKYSLTTLSNTETRVKNYNVKISGKKLFQLWIRSSQVGNLMEVEITDGTNTETFQIIIEQIGQFALYEFDVSNSIVNNITSLTIRFKNITVGTDIHVDEITILRYGSIHYRLPAKKITYNLNENNKYIDMELGTEYNKLDEYMSGLQAQMELNNSYGQNR